MPHRELLTETTCTTSLLAACSGVLIWHRATVRHPNHAKQKNLLNAWPVTWNSPIDQKNSRGRQRRVTESSTHTGIYIYVFSYKSVCCNGCYSQ